LGRAAKQWTGHVAAHTPAKGCAASGFLGVSPRRAAPRPGARVLMLAALVFVLGAGAASASVSATPAAVDVVGAGVYSPASARAVAAKKTLLRICLLFLAVLCVGGSARAVTITRTSSPVFYIDSSANPTPLKCMYVSYQINNNGSYLPDVWVTIGSFTGIGGVVSLAPNEDGLQRLGAMNPGETKTAFFYIQASGPTNNAQQHTISVYEGMPPSGTFVTSANFSMTVTETLQANANKVTTVVSGPNPAALGGTLTMTVTGSSGTIGNANVLSFSPATYLTWAASSYELYQSTIQLSSPNAGTFTNQLLIPASAITSSADTPYTATYLFRAVNFTSGPTAVSPVGFISSGNQVKHTDTSGYASLAPVQQINNTTTLTKLTNTSVVFGVTVVTYTARLMNSGSSDVNIDDVVDTLPTTPASVTYVANSSAYDGAAIPEPAVSGSTLTWARTFTIPAGQTKDLTYRVSIPGTTLGTYTNRVFAHIATVQIDTTINVNDNAPASVNVLATTPPSVALSKCVYSGAQCVSTPTTASPGADLAYTIGFTNTGGYYAANFVITDQIPSNTDFKVGSVSTDLGTTGLTVSVSYSNDGGATWTYTPAGGGGGAPSGYDRSVTHVRWSFTGSLSQTAPNNAGSASFTTRIR
jgi:uncharacterized repeat protein (TIGR01451 family)